MLCKIADFTVEIECRYPYLPALCKNYRVDVGEPLFRVSVTDEEILQSSKNGAFTAGYSEGACAYKKICEKLAEYRAVLFHAAVVVVDGKAYAFTAKSGTGKSTHVKLWLEYLGKKAYVLNGDKPIVRDLDGTLYAYGTPWCGKEGWNRNEKAPLCGICFLERSWENFIEPLPPKEASQKIFSSMLKPPTEEGVRGTLEMADKILTEVPLYRMGCNISLKAAELSYKTMSGEGKTNEN